ncbi:DUF2852 domain-containing protein [Sulfitobacter sp. LCG007]
MTYMTQSRPMEYRPGWFSRAENWLDDKGKGAWMASMVLGFVFFWPVGLALLFYMIWSKRMFSKSCSKHSRSVRSGMRAMRPTGNNAFDSYKADTLARLEQEQADFEAFLERLREAKDKAEFDEFMKDRTTKSTGEERPEA